MSIKEYISCNSLVIPLPQTKHIIKKEFRYCATEITIENQSHDGIEFEKIK